MRNTKHKLLAALLSVCLFVGLAVPAFAETKTVIEMDFGDRPTTTEDVTQKPEGGPEILVYSGTDSDGKNTYKVIYWCFLANGTPITVKQNPENSKKVDIIYGNYKYTSPEYQWNNEQGDIVTYRLCIFGGGHNSTTKYESTSVTLESGEVFILSGGGLHGSKIGTANTVMKGGFASNVYASGIGYNGISSDGCNDGVKYKDNDRTLIENAKATISGGACNLLCGGPMAYGHTINATVTMTGGKVRAYGSPSGTNGYTENAVYKMSGGSITELYGVINGKTKNITMEITEDASVTKVMHAASDDVGVLDENPSISLTIDTKGTIEKLTPGFNGKDNAVTDAGIISGKYNRNSVTNYKELLTKEEFGTAFANLLPIPAATTVTPTVKDDDDDATRKTAVETAVTEAIEASGSEIKNGDAIVSDIATVPSNASSNVSALLGIVSKIPGPDGAANTSDDKTLGVLVSSLTEVEATETGALTAVTFDVTPYTYTPASGIGGTSTLTENTTPGKAVTFYLPVPSDWSGYVEAYHDGKSMGKPKPIIVDEENTQIKYVALSSDSFSPFTLKKSNWKPTPAPTPSYSSGGTSTEFYVTVIAGANGKAKEAEGFYARDERHTFTMIPDEGYVIDTVTLDDGSVLSHTDTEFVLFVDEPYEVHVTFKKAAGSTTTAPTGKPPVSTNPQTSDSWFSGLF